MAIFEQVTLGAPDITHLTKDQVHVAFVLKVPFRLCVGKFFRIQISSTESFEIICRNDFVIPEGTKMEKWEEIKTRAQKNLMSGYGVKKSHIFLWTDVIVIWNHPNIKSSDVNALKGEYFDDTKALKAFNQFLIAYSNVHTFSGTVRMNGVRTLELLEWWTCSRAIFQIVCPAQYKISDQEINSFFDRAPGPSERFNMSPQPEDLGIDKLASIEAALIRQQEYIFYEFAFQARRRKEERDISGGLLMAVVALEGVHAAFVRQVLSEPLQKAGRKTSESFELLSNFLRDQGITTLLQITSAIFLQEDEMPSTADLDAAVRGISMRNAIMHALTDNKGRYKIHKYTETEMDQAYNSVVVVYKCFVQALEHRLNEKNSDD